MSNELPIGFGKFGKKGGEKRRHGRGAWRGKNRNRNRKRINKRGRIKKSSEFPECCDRRKCNLKFCLKSHPNIWFQGLEKSPRGFNALCTDISRDLFDLCKTTSQEILMNQKGICFKVNCKNYACKKFHIIKDFYVEVKNLYFKRSYDLIDLNEEERKAFSYEEFRGMVWRCNTSALTPFSVIEKEVVSEDGEKYDVFCLVGLEQEHRKGRDYEELKKNDLTKMNYSMFGGKIQFLPKDYNEKNYDLHFQETALREFKEEVLIGENLMWRKNKKVEEQEQEEEGEESKKDKQMFEKERFYGKIIQCFSDDKIQKGIVTYNFPVFVVGCEYFDIEKNIKPVLIEKEKNGEYLEKTNFAWLKVDNEFFENLKNILESYEIIKDEYGMIQIKNTRALQKKYIEAVKDEKGIDIVGEIVFNEGDIQGKSSKNFCGVDEKDRNRKYSFCDYTVIQILCMEEILRDAMFNGFDKFKDILVLKS